VLSIIGVIIVNFLYTYTGNKIATPEPQTTIALFTYLAYLPFLVASYFIGLRKDRPRKKPKQAEESAGKT